MKKVVIGSDHAGFELKEILKKELPGQGFEIIDVGAYSIDSVDYPDFAIALSKKIKEGGADKGILICGSGIGMSISANRNKEIRAALCINEEMAKLSRQHNDANVLVLGARLVDKNTAFSIVKAFFSTEFEGGRHINRVKKLSNHC